MGMINLNQDAGGIFFGKQPYKYIFGKHAERRMDGYG